MVWSDPTFVMNRGDRGETYSGNDADYERFLSTLGEACGKTEWQMHAYLNIFVTLLKLATLLCENVENDAHRISIRSEV